MPIASQSESCVSFRPDAYFSRRCSLRIFPNALSAKIKPSNPNMKPMLPALPPPVSNKIGRFNEPGSNQAYPLLAGAAARS